MMRLEIVVISISMFLLLCSPVVVSSADAPPRPAPRERPRIPAQLDRATLQTYLDTVEQPRIASSLKVGYFGGRTGAQSIPIGEGFALLKATIEKEPVASKRWFYLQNVRGWASFRNPEIAPDEGFAAYSELFAQADKAKAAGTVYAVQTAVSDWVTTVSNRLARLRGEDGDSLRDDERTAGVLLKAWTAYVSLLQQTEGRWNGREPDWSRAIQRAGVGEEFITAVEKSVADPKTPKTFFLLHGAAAALRWTKPDRALEFFAQAKPLLPRDKAGKFEQRIAEAFFDDWLGVLQNENKSAEALAVSRERVALLNSGHAKLLRLQLDNKHSAGVVATLRVLAAVDAPEREINAVAAVLNKRWADDRKNTTFADQSTALLNGYLNSARPRSLTMELEARYRLGWLLLEQNKRAEAKAALSIAHLTFDENRLDPQTQFILKNIRAMHLKSDTTQ